jgi:hypothetical protein
MSDEQKNNGSSSSNNATATPGAADVSPTVALFQKAHASLVTLQRLDEQLAALVERRRRAQADLREAQAQLNEEIDRAATPSTDESAMRIGARRPSAPIAEAA